jgi:hypothetical protein
MSIGRTTLAALAVTTAVCGCASSSGTPPDGSGGVVDQTLARTSALASALDSIPDLSNVSVAFTDWAMLDHRAATNPNAAPFAEELLWGDNDMQKDLGIRSTSADWEIDLWPPGGRAGTFVLGFERHTDLAGLAGKLTRFGYHQDGPIFTGKFDRRHMWTLGLRNIGIDTGRQLFVGGPDASAVRSVLAGSASPLGHDGSVTPLLALAAARLDRIATASVVVGSGACVRLAGLVRNASPVLLANLRKRFTGTFTPPQAELTALNDPAAATAFDALTFPDHGAAQANKASRSAAAKVLNDLDAGGIRVTGSRVTGRVLGFTVAAGQPHGVVQGVEARTLGVDICP